jgi:hypothetical protein
VAITQHGETQVGAQAFRSAGYLRSTIGPHEGTHHEQQLRGLTGLGPRAEIEALNAELNAAEQNGLNAWEINELYRLRGAQLMELNYGPRWWSIPGLSPLR